MRIGYIYKIVNPNGKVYVGQTINLENRLRQYKYAQCKHQVALYNSIKKYGWSNHIFEIIEQFEIQDKIVLNEREKYWIKDLKSFGPNGFNCNEGGNGNTGRRCSDETKKKISLGNLGKKVSEEAKKKIGDASKGRVHIVTQEIKNKISKSKIGIKQSEETIKKKIKASLGKKRTEETKLKMSKAQQGRIVSEETKKKIGDGHRGKPWSEARRQAQKK